MQNNSLSYANLLGQKPHCVESVMHPIFKRAESGDMDAIFDMSRYYWNYEYQTESLQSALYYKSLFVENYPEGDDVNYYSCAITMLEIAQILCELEQKETAIRYFIKCYKTIFANYPEMERRAILEDIEFFEVVGGQWF